MNVTFDKEAFKRQIIDRELALIGKMQVIALRGRNRGFCGTQNSTALLIS